MTKESGRSSSGASDSNPEFAGEFPIGIIRVVLKYPLVPVVATLGIAILFAIKLSGFELEASPASLTLEEDPNQRIYDLSRMEFGSDEYVIVAFTAGDVFSPETISLIERLTSEFKAIEGVEQVLSLTSVRLFQSEESPPNILRLRFGKPVYLTSESCQIEKGRKELLEHKLYSNNLVSEDGRTAALIAYIEIDRSLMEVERERLRVRESLASLEKDDDGKAAEYRKKLESLDSLHEVLHRPHKEKRLRIISSIFSILDRYGGSGFEFYVSGLPVIQADMMEYMKHDILVFGTAIVGLLLLVLLVIFRKIRWVILPVLTCLVTVVGIMGLTVAMGKKATVISCNLSSLLFVVAMAHSIHIIVRYRELRARSAETSYKELILETMEHIWVPCFYTAATTVVGFASLLISGIRPVMDFGAFMCAGVGVAFVVSFVFFPAALALLRPPRVKPSEVAESGAMKDLAAFGVRKLASFNIRRRWWIATVGFIAGALSLAGMYFLDVEAGLMDYFGEDTSIHRGLGFIDRRLGGTTTLEVILRGQEEGYFSKKKNMEKLRKLHCHIEESPQVGKVLSIVSLVGEFEKVLDATKAGVTPTTRQVLEFLQEAAGRESLKPYITEDFSSARLVVRMHESAFGTPGPGFRTPRGPTRRQVIDDLKRHLEREPELSGIQKDITGIFLLYTNMLDTLVMSQIKSFGLVFAMILVMLAVLFRSLRVGLIGLIPNALPILLVLGIMGWAGIRLDMATVMIASVSLGIAVDSTIHYGFRFKKELAVDGDYVKAMYRSHDSIGRAILYTSFSVIAGFWVLVLSKFKPTVYFGLFTGVAMAAALFGALTVLPLCLLLFRPFKVKEPPRRAGLPRRPGVPST